MAAKRARRSERQPDLLPATGEDRDAPQTLPDVMPFEILTESAIEPASGGEPGDPVAPGRQAPALLGEADGLGSKQRVWGVPLDLSTNPSFPKGEWQIKIRETGGGLTLADRKLYNVLL